MKTEYEVKFLNVNIDDMRARLHTINATLEKPMRLMRRVTIDKPEFKDKNAFLRIRDEGDKITITYKQFDSLSIDGAKEHEIIVDDFNKSIALFTAVGLPYGAFQESKRETWIFDGAEIVIDEWPWLSPYVEIESYNETHIKKIAKKLGFNWNDATFGAVMVAYRKQYPHLTAKDTIGNIPEVKFNAPLPSLLKNS